MLYDFYRKNALFNKYALVFYGYTAKNTILSAKSMLEWMSNTCQNELNEKQINAFDFPDLIVCQSEDEFFNNVLQNKNYCCIATNEFMEGGFAQHIFMKICQTHNNTILLTNRQQKVKQSHKQTNKQRKKTQIKNKK